MSPEQRRIQQLEKEVKELKDFARSFENKGQLAPNIQRTIVQVVGAVGLGNLSNVVLTSPANGEVLKFNGTNWVNDTDLT